jgi:hypothetical protein
MLLKYVFFASKIVCLQSDLNMKSLNQNVMEQENHRKIKEIPASLTLLALPMQHK